MTFAATWQDNVSKEARQAEEAALARAKARTDRVDLIRTILLRLGQDVLNVPFDPAEYQDGLSLARREWEILLSQEAQIPRDTYSLDATRSRVAGLAVEEANATLEMARIRAHDERVGLESQLKDLEAALVALKAQAKAKRSELESFTKKR